MSTHSKNILLISSSPNPESNSRALALTLAQGLAQDRGSVTIRDLGANPPPHLDQATIGAFYTPPADRTPEQQAKIALSEELVDELFAADEIVIAAPMHNFGISSLLKVWLDHIARFGRTFEPTGQGRIDGRERARVDGRPEVQQRRQPVDPVLRVQKHRKQKRQYHP